VTGAGSTLNVDVGLFIGAGCGCGPVGTMTVADGGTVNSTGFTTIGSNSTLNLGTGGLAGSIVTPTITNDGQIVANFTDTLTLAADIDGAGSIRKLGTGKLTLSGNNSYTGGTTIGAGTIAVSSDANLGDVSGGLTLGLNLLGNPGGTLETTASFSSARAITLNSGGGTIATNSGVTTTLSGVIDGGGHLTKSGDGILVLTGTNTYGGGTRINGGTLAVSSDANLGNAAGTLSFNGGALQTMASFDSARAITINAGGGIFNTDGGVQTRLTGVIDGAGGLIKNGTGLLILTGANSYSGGTIVNSGTLQLGEVGVAGAIRGAVMNNGATLNFINVNTSGLTGVVTNSGNTNFRNDSSAGSALIISNSGGTTTFEGSSSAGNATVVANSGGTTIFNGNSSASNATVITNVGGVTQFLGTSNGSSARFITNAGGVLSMLGLGPGPNSAGSIEGAGTYALGNGVVLQVGGNNLSTEVSGIITGVGGELFKYGSGTLTLSGANTYTGPTTVNQGRLAVNGSITSNVTVYSLGNLGGSGTIFGNVMNYGTLAPGNSIGTLTVSGNYTQAPGSTYQVEVNAAGQGDRLNVVGAPGTATINGGTVQVLAQPGNYARNTTYTILNATGGVSGTYSNVTSNFAFLTPSLLYDANNVFLNLYLSSTAFASGAQTVNQFAVGTALDRGYGAATGDFANVLGALTGLSTAQGPAALDALSGQNYAGFGTANVQGGLAYMNVVGQQMSLARGGSGGGSRMALAQACEVACDADSISPFSIWGSAVGATGSFAGNGNSSTLTYNLGGFATGIDYRIDPRFLAGLSLGYGSGNQWLGGFNGRGTSDSYNIAAYGSFTPGAFYIDALAGYGYNDNTMTRQIIIPGLAARTAMGRTGANQFTGQAETGYRFDLYAPAAASVTPFARFQTMSVNQNAFSESGANSLNLSVAQQTTTSVRTVIGTELSGAVDLGWRDKLGLQLRLGWSHEYADVSRPVNASFQGAPGIGYTVYGAAPQRDGAVIGLAASTALAQNTSIYLRYDGEFGTGTDNHVLNAGLRLSW